MDKKILNNQNIATYYETHNILEEIEDEEVELSLNDRLKEEILTGKRNYNLKNISIKINPYQIQAIKMIATMKSIPYQTLIRHWLSENIKRELSL